MVDNSTLAISVEEALQLGSACNGLRQLQQTIEQQIIAKSPGATLKIIVTSLWFDITVLSCFCQQIREARSHFHRVDLFFPSITAKHVRFLWRTGFWQLLGANAEGSNLTCQPDPWRTQPIASKARANFTSLLFRELDTSFHVKPLVSEWQSQLEDIEVFRHIENSDLIQSREYLFLLLWELTQNAAEHSKGRSLILAGQLLLAGTTQFSDRNGPGNNPRLVARLRGQHEAEIQHSATLIRREWLENHGSDSFLIMSCTDNGIGIPSSLRDRRQNEHSTDEKILLDAFKPEVSTRMADPSLFDVHGLSQVIRLVRESRGYLFVQSGHSRFECGDDAELALRDPQTEPLPGTLFQIILPLSERRSAVYVSPPLKAEAIVATRSEVEESEFTYSLTVFEELPSDAVICAEHPEQWPGIVSALIEQVPPAVRHLSLDFVCMPPERQFAGYILRSFRRRFLNVVLVVINASRELQAIVRSLAKLDAGVPLTDVEATGWLESDKDISTALARGETGWSLPLLLPITSVEPDSSRVLIQWMGLSGVRDAYRPAVRFALDFVFAEEAPVRWEELLAVSIDSGLVAKSIGKQFLSSFRSICRCNGALLHFSTAGCTMNLSPPQLYHASYLSLRREFDTRILPHAQHSDPTRKKRLPYSFGWRPLETRFRRRFFRAWDILTEPNALKIATDLLLRTAFLRLGEPLLSASAVLSITPSAGLLGRRIAQVLNLDFFELPSIHDVQTRESLALPPGSRVLIVEDVFDTGTLSHSMLAFLQSAKCECVAILALVRSDEGLTTEDPLEVPVIHATNVSLGFVSKAQRDDVLRTGEYYEVDPASLDPVPPRVYSQVVNKGEVIQQRHRLQLLVRSGAMVSDHFVQAGHHYDVFFNIVAALADPGVELMLFDWIRTQLESFSRDGRDSVTVVYPYYSPIHHLVTAMQSERHSVGLPKEKIFYVVAKPVFRSGNRLGYSIRMPQSYPRKVVFMDNGVATGGTFGSMIDELVHHGAQAILGMVIFDRIGYHPRRHLRRVNSYRSETITVPFSFETFVSVNLRSYFADNCPECRTRRSLKKLGPHRGIVSYSVDALLMSIARQRVPFGALRLPSRLNSQETLEVVVFRDAVFSDRPSGRDIIESLLAARKSPRAKAAMLSTVLMDRKLDRQIADRALMIDLIHTVLCHGMMDTETRSRFILNIPRWHDHELAFNVLTHTIPSIFRRLSGSTEVNAEVLDTYFNQNVIEFAATAVALHEVVAANETDDLIQRALERWRAFFPAHDSPYGSAYFFELRQLLDRTQRQALEQARFLVTNFVGTYSIRHPEALRQRMWLFMTLLRSSNDDLARTILPLPILQALTDAIRAVQSISWRERFNHKDLLYLVDCYQAWSDDINAKAELMEAIHVHFVSKNPHVITPTMDLLLEDITPSTADVLSRATESFKDLVEQKADCLTVIANAEIDASHVLCPAGFLIYTISHLLLNPLQRRCGKRLDQPLGDLKITLSTSFCGANDTTLEICVRDNMKESTQADLDTAFVKGGGLSAQQLRIQDWNGSLKAVHVDDGSAFLLRIERAYLSD